MSTDRSGPEYDDLRAVVSELAERLERVEARLGIPAKAAAKKPEPVEVQRMEQGTETRREGDSLEFEVGQTWFALIGIFALAIGMAFLLSLPFAGLPVWAPSTAGYLASALILYLARVSQKSFQEISKYLRGAGMLLLFFATLRLFYFGAESALEATSLAGIFLLLVTVGLNLVLAWRRKSPILYVLAMLTGCGAALAVGTPWFVAGLLTVLVGLAVYAQIKLDWRSMAPVVFSAVVLTYFLWALGNPFLTGTVRVVSESYPVVFCIPLWIGLFSYALIQRPDRDHEDTPVQVADVLMCGLGFSVFFLHHLLGHESRLMVGQIVMAVLMLGISLVFWRREKSKFSTFIYA
ncbi:MAG: hypothetical protein ACO3ZW_02245, partial [Opitutales bacterium]